MTRWFRFYDGALDDPKVQSLPPELFKAWVNLLCVASRNDGKLPAADLSFMLRMDDRKTGKTIDDLVQRGLLDREGDDLEPHNWPSRQFKSDVSNERVKRYRQRHGNGTRNVTETPLATPPETEQNRAEKESPSGRDAPKIASRETSPLTDEITEAGVFSLGKTVLGKNAGGVITKLKKHLNHDLKATHDLLLQAKAKENPMEWVQAAMRPVHWRDQPEYRGVDVG